MRRQDFWDHKLFVRQRSQLVNALQDHLAEYGVDVAQAVVQFRRMIASFDEVAVDLPAQIGSLWQAYIDQIAFLMKGLVRWIMKSKARQKQMKQHHGL